MENLTENELQESLERNYALALGKGEFGGQVSPMQIAMAEATVEAILAEQRRRWGFA